MYIDTFSLYICRSVWQRNGSLVVVKNYVHYKFYNFREKAHPGNSSRRVHLMQWGKFSFIVHQRIYRHAMGMAATLKTTCRSGMDFAGTRDECTTGADSLLTLGASTCTQVSKHTSVHGIVIFTTYAIVSK